MVKCKCKDCGKSADVVGIQIDGVYYGKDTPEFKMYMRLFPDE